MTFQDALGDVMNKARCAKRTAWPDSKFIYRGLAGVIKTSLGMSCYIVSAEDWAASDWQTYAAEPDNGANPALVLERRAVTVEGR